MICSSCSSEQALGNFCLECGSPFEVSYSRVDHRAKSAEPNVYVENMKKKSKAYRSYFVQQLKKPSLAFQHGEKDFSNGLLSIVLFAMLYAIALFLLANTASSGFLSFFIQAALLTLVLIGMVLFSLYMINNFFGPEYSFKSIVSFYGGQLSPLVVGVALALVLIAIKSFTYGNVLLVVSFMFALFVLPLYIMSYLVIKKSAGLDALYGFVLYIVMFSVLFVILVTLLADSTLGLYFEQMFKLF
ncbi:hypothetical protein [Psychrobacillus sp.]|uniref:hypothetical protein n=1 Tax=Psychrobacillus sp. TaxID=1871623 RepID=UPI0028BDF43F|nr:hypothetical protein [Psychrobacillus sp.]